MEADDQQPEDEIKESMSDVDDDKDSIKVTGGTCEAPPGGRGRWDARCRPARGTPFFFKF